MLRLVSGSLLLLSLCVGVGLLLGLAEGATLVVVGLQRVHLLGIVVWSLLEVGVDSPDLLTAGLVVAIVDELVVLFS